jgi:hypothetical protein
LTSIKEVRINPIHDGSAVVERRLEKRGRKKEPYQKVDSIDAPSRDVSRGVGGTGSQEFDISGTRLSGLAQQRLAQL